MTKNIKELRKVQKWGASLTICLPQRISDSLGIQKGDYLLVKQKGNRVEIEKIIPETSSYKTPPSREWTKDEV